MKRTLCAVLALILTLSSFVFTAHGDDVDEIDFHTEEQRDFIRESFDDLASISKYATGTSEQSVPDPILLEFYDDGIAESDRYVVQIAHSADFSDCKTVTGIRIKEYEYYNALLGEHFYWRAGADLDTIAASPVHEVTVSSEGPRNLYVPGLTNVRDVGGYASSLVPGGVIKQGLCYRGGQIDDMRDEGCQVLVNDLGVRAEIDLRGYTRAGGYRKGIEYIDYHSAVIGMEEGQDLFSAYDYTKSFSVIAEAGEKPVYLHCIAGADRTGIISFMLLVACGVSFHDAALDYLFTCFSTHGMRYESTVRDYYERLGEYEGDTKAEQAKSWIISKGVSEYTVERIRETFVEGYESEYLKNLEPERLYGDMNGDGKLNARDVVALMKAIIAKDMSNMIADMNRDGKLNARDVNSLMKAMITK